MAELLAGARVLSLGSQHQDAAAQVLAESFRRYPLTRYIFAAYGDDFQQPLAASFRIDCAWRVALGWPFLGVYLPENPDSHSDEKLVAVALLAGLSPRPQAHPLSEEEQQLNRSFGQQTRERLQAYLDLKARHAPAQPHYYLEAIGVLPAYRRQGHAGRLLQRAAQISLNDPASQGVALDTQAAENLLLYAHFGYRVYAQEMIGSVQSWFLYCSNPDSKEGESRQ